MRIVQWSFALLFLGASAWFCPVQSGAQKEKEPAGKGGDAAFVMKASESDLTEIALGRLAMKQAENPKVREFASRMVEDHTKCSQELTTIAKKHNIPVATESSKKHQEMITKLSNIKGADFDRQYMDGQVKAHQSAVKLFQDEAKNGQNPDLKAFAQKTLPDIENHLKHAQQIVSQLGGK
jgi:putative membrane protein